VSHVLIVEDEEVIRGALRRLLERNGYRVSDVANVAEARALLAEASADLILADLRLPDAPGTDLIGIQPETPVLIMTSYASVRSAVDAMKLGAVDYVAKPFDHDELLLAMERILKERRLERQNRALRGDLARSYPVAGMIGRCPSMREVFARIDKVAPTDSTVLILGESGTGKELVARALHEKSRRRDGPLVSVNCASIPQGLIENELFGHEKGSFTGAVASSRGLVEAADGGTLFLDEVGELPLEAQARLLRVLEKGEIRRVGSARPRHVDLRLIAATHRDLRALSARGAFREDLFFRLHVMEIRLPPLRERGHDIAELAEALMARTCERLGRPVRPFSGEAMQAILEHDWPGNVRELENAIERAVILCDGEAITPELLSLERRHETARAAPADESRGDLSLEDYFRRFVESHQDSMTETELASRLGISRKALWERRQRLGIPRPKSKA